MRDLNICKYNECQAIRIKAGKKSFHTYDGKALDLSDNIAIFDEMQYDSTR